MAGNERFQKNEEFGMRLTRAERKLILQGVSSLPEEIAQTIHAAPAKQPIVMILDDLKELSGHIAAEANNAGATMLQKKLDTIVSKIQYLLETHTDEEVASTRRSRTPAKRRHSQESRSNSPNGRRRC